MEISRATAGMAAPVSTVAVLWWMMLLSSFTRAGIRAAGVVGKATLVQLIKVPERMISDRVSGREHDQKSGVEAGEKAGKKVQEVEEGC